VIHIEGDVALLRLYISFMLIIKTAVTHYKSTIITIRSSQISTPYIY